MSGKPLASSRKKSTNPLAVLSKSSPSAATSLDVIVTLGSKRMLEA